MGEIKTVLEPILCRQRKALVSSLYNRVLVWLKQPHAVTLALFACESPATNGTPSFLGLMNEVNEKILVDN